MTKVKSADAIMREANGTLEMRAVEDAAPPLVIVSGEERKTYRLKNASAEELIQAKRRYESLAEADAAFEPATWVALLSTFMERGEASRMLKEQGMGTVRLVIVTLTQRAVQQLSKE